MNQNQNRYYFKMALMKKRQWMKADEALLCALEHYLVKLELNPKFFHTSKN